MKTLIEKIPASDFKHYIIRSKNCRPGPVYELEPKYGLLAFDFKKFNADFAEITIRRRHGNGVCIAVCEDKNIDFKISSKSYQKMMFPLGGEGILEFKRTKTSIGSVDISHIDLFVNNVQPKINWKEILSKCNYEGVVLKGDKAFASEGSVIRAKQIKEIVTVPPNFFSKTDVDIIFTNKCEIKKLVVVGESLETNTFKHFIEEPQVLQSEKTKPSNITYSKIQIPQKKSQIESPGISRLIFDSSAVGFQKHSSSGNVVVEKTHVILDFNAEYRIPLKFLYPNSEYIIIVEGHALSGNGKVTITTDNAINDNNAAFMFGPQKKTINKNIKTSANAEGAHLIIGRSPSGKGKILITKILLILDIDKEAKIPSVVFSPNENNSVGFLDTNEENKVLKDSLAFSRHVSYHNFSKINNKIIGKLAVKTFSGMSWFSKIQPLFPNIDIENNQDHSLITSIKMINRPATNVLLEEFFEDEITKTQAEILSRCGNVFSPSERNIETIKKQVPDVTISKLFKIWPFVTPSPVTFIKQDFILIFNRNKDVTNKYLEALKECATNIAVVGARGKYPSYVYPFNEYTPYNNLCWLMQKAKCIIDIPLINDYKSGAVELITQMKTPLATNNLNYKDHNNVSFIVSDEKFKDYKIPSVELLINNVREVCSVHTERYNMTEDYNEQILEVINRML